MIKQHVEIPQKGLTEFCRRHHIKKLAFFGSVLTEKFNQDSDIDVLVEFEPDHVPGLITLAGMELELSEILGGCKVDINTQEMLSHYYRDKAVAESKVAYAA